MGAKELKYDYCNTNYWMFFDQSQEREKAVLNKNLELQKWEQHQFGQERAGEPSVTPEQLHSPLT